MPAAAPENSEWDLPRLRASFGFEDDFQYVSADDQGDTEFFDVKFYPYNPASADPIFAAVSKKHVVVCRLSQTKDSNPCEIIRVIRDDDPEALNCSCCWTKDTVTERAHLCIAGRDAKVKVYNIKEGKLITTLVGHGGEINDLVTSPDNPHLIASASDDTTVRIWSLDPVHSKQPCVALLGGEGHSWNLLSVAFHSTGRYILSAGHDQVINLWTLPDIPKQHVDVPLVVHYPHFSTSDIHSGLIDCVAFYGDCILSRACHEETIVLWRIEGFSSEDPPPAPSTAPTTYDQSRTTRSAFAPVISPACPAQYTRLLQFQTPGCGPQFFMRFSMFHAYGHHPILAFCNAKSSIFFWDLNRLTAYQEFIETLTNPARDKTVPVPRPSWLQPVVHRKKVGDAVSKLKDASDRDSMTTSPDPDIPTTEYSAETLASWKSKYDMSDPHGFMKPHKTEQFGSATFVGRQVAWSPDGEWCVIVGSRNLAVILQRWAKDKARNGTPDERA
ncbi:Polycomb protein esc [Pleurostoma richardsiae]|uniref:Polycomb protein esc n=1 Tax=Pleurostoma richardsiae TaxID=41990 RepID=A0AA38R100_9PEZI|nr:Polycomb protein esc [Pleurostoma richardsiae]